MCKGSRYATTVSDSLVLENRKATPDSDRLLTAEANAVMKGVRHTELNPFLRRLSREGLWDLKTPFERLDQSKRDLIMFGFWSRPGAGSFLKTASANPAEVGSWLRWDGLYRHVLDRADRSRNVEWARRVQGSASRVPCHLCGATGFQPFARLLHVGNRSFVEWTRLQDADRMLDSLRAVQPQTPRQRRTLQRILYCLGPLTNLRSAAAPAAVVKRSVESFTTMPAVELKEADVS